jgi:hypothetical protein
LDADSQLEPEHQAGTGTWSPPNDQAFVVDETQVTQLRKRFES